MIHVCSSPGKQSWRLILMNSVPEGLKECYVFPFGIKQWHGHKEPMGEPAATYGEPRLGVGWRD